MISHKNNIPSTLSDYDRKDAALQRDLLFLSLKDIHNKLENIENKLSDFFKSGVCHENIRI